MTLSKTSPNEGTIIPAKAISPKAPKPIIAKKVRAVPVATGEEEVSNPPTVSGKKIYRSRNTRAV